MLYPIPAVPVPSPPPPPLEEVGLEVERVGRQVAWHRPFAEAADDRGPVLLLFHGNGENLETLRRAGVLAAFDDLGRPYLAIDYPGYGQSAGSPSEPHLLAGGRAAAAWMRQRYEGRQIVPVGWSLGAAVAIQLVAGGEAQGLVAISPWTSLEAIGSDHFPAWLVGLVVRERYDSLAAAPRVERPALVIHGERDRIIPVEHGRRVAAALPEARWVE
ncbi:MAG: alpha/beta hydrolase, partial [Thermoanaerobaculia bacterium]|nr:alpha/beta hydrolase [Thermoanaerobaculia bacterium]